ncbi:VTT domain-containing protein [Lapidilactobacillus bayanensis]|uniref:VTT domain-containing protein n=1 Tax=Lapidilactobacillus bayanensis TaxID=2485998 RepID=UPI000F79DFE8|nr:VTT domain-containing protein [Lapidilactobacillus bayanensis]
MKTLRRILLYALAAGLVLVLIYGIYHHFENEIQAFLHSSKETQQATGQRLLRSIRQHQRDPFVLTLIITLIAVMTAIPFMPISIVCIAIGVGYGGLIGGLINAVGISLGNLAVIGIFELTGLSRRIAAHDSRIIDDIAKMHQPLLGLTIGYSVPFISTLFVDVTALHLNYTLRQLWLPVIIGSLPVAFIYAFGGNLFNNGDLRVGIFILVAMVLLASLTILIKQDRKQS